MWIIENVGVRMVRFPVVRSSMVRLCHCEDVVNYSEELEKRYHTRHCKNIARRYYSKRVSPCFSSLVFSSDDCRWICRGRARLQRALNIYVRTLIYIRYIHTQCVHNTTRNKRERETEWNKNTVRIIRLACIHSAVNAHSTVIHILVVSRRWTEKR